MNLFESYHPLKHNEHTITILDGRQIEVKCIGTVFLPSGIKLKNILFVPQIRFNLISTHKPCKDLNYNVIFNSNGCIVQDLSMREPWLLGKIKQGLYYADNLIDAFSGSATNKTHKMTCYITTYETCSSSHVSSTDMHHKAKLWHLRLGHIPFHKLKLLFPVESLPSHYFCTLCLMAKQTRLSFTHSVIKTCYPIEYMWMCEVLTGTK